MKIYCSKDPFDVKNYIGKDLWVEGTDDEGRYQYFRFLSFEDGIVTCNVIYADIIDDLDVGYLLDEFPSLPPEQITLQECEDRFFTTEIEYYLDDLKIYETLEVMDSADIIDCLRRCLDKL